MRVFYILEFYIVEKVSSVSVGVGIFYNWVGQILLNFLY